jgi:hypothetical protein
MGDTNDRERNYERLSIYLFVDCIFGDGSSERIRVRNISKSGLGGQIEGKSSPAEGQRVTLAFRELQPFEGTVAWVTGRNLGVAFDSPIDPSKLLPGLSNRRGV